LSVNVYQDITKIHSEILNKIIAKDVIFLVKLVMDQKILSALIVISPNIDCLRIGIRHVYVRKVITMMAR